MIILNVSSHKLEAGLGAGVSTTPVDITVVYYDELPLARVDADTRPRYSVQESTVSSATVTTICNATGADGIVRNIIGIFGYNRDATSVTLSINKNLATASTFYNTTTLITKQKTWYEHGFGWGG